MSASLLNTEYDAAPTGWECFGKTYGVYEQQFATVESHTLAWLLKAEAILQALMKRGVHNFEHYDAAMEAVTKGRE